jgi:GNAT superfamily N-acetyltransferase
MITDEKQMCGNNNLYSENGVWLMIFGVDTLPKYQHKGCASKLMYNAIDTAKKGIVLTCKPHLMSFGFLNEGVANSVRPYITARRPEMYL